MAIAAVACTKEAGTTARAEHKGVHPISFREPREAGLAYERKPEYDIASLFMVQLLLCCDQNMREKAWRSRKRGA